VEGHGSDQAVRRSDWSTQADAEDDHIHVAELQQTTWQSATVPCSGAGSNSTAVDVLRQGSPP
jgi:hypothetical protein